MHGPMYIKYLVSLIAVGCPKSNCTFSALSTTCASTCYVFSSISFGNCNITSKRVTNSGNYKTPTRTSPVILFHSRAVIRFRPILTSSSQIYFWIWKLHSRWKSPSLCFDVTVRPVLSVLYLTYMKLIDWNVIWRDLFMFMSWLYHFLYFFFWRVVKFKSLLK